jgi:hypothetical protein
MSLPGLRLANEEAIRVRIALLQEGGEINTALYQEYGAGNPVGALVEAVMKQFFERDVDRIMRAGAADAGPGAAMRASFADTAAIRATIALLQGSREINTAMYLGYGAGDPVGALVDRVRILTARASASVAAGTPIVPAFSGATAASVATGIETHAPSAPGRGSPLI